MLYFTVREQEYHDADGALWALAPTGLNNEHGLGRSIPGMDSPNAIVQFHDAFRPTKRATGNVAFSSHQWNLRQLTQQSMFTVHAETLPLQGHDNAEGHLAWFRVPAALKPGLLAELRLLGVTDDYLFPDLEHLAQEVKNLTFVK